jgi:ketosteroid isomerase-like protein
MAIERAPEVEAIVREANDAWHRGDVEALERMTSRSDAVLMVGTDATEIWRGPEQAIEGLHQALDEAEGGGPRSRTEDVTAYRAGDVAWTFEVGVFTVEDGSGVPFRTVSILHREDGEWKYVQSVASLSVPNSAWTEPSSPLVETLAAR